MLYLDSENKKDLNVYINCSGGEVDSFLELNCKSSDFTIAPHAVQTDSLVLRADGEACCLTWPAEMQVVPCLALHDTMRHVRSDVATVGFGGCMGMMGFMLAMGKKVCH